MAEFPMPLLTVAVALPLSAALAITRIKADVLARRVTVGALGVTLCLLLGVLRGVLSTGGGVLRGAPDAWLLADPLSIVPMLIFTIAALVTAVAAPRRDTNRAFLIGLLILTGSTLLAYSAANLLVFLAGWIVAMLPFTFGTVSRFTRFVLVCGALSLSVAVVLIGVQSPASWWAFAFLALAAILREQLAPFHPAAVALFEDGPMLLGALLSNSHLGVFLIARFALPMLEEGSDSMLAGLGALSLFTAIYTAVLGIGERKPRRLLALLMVSQSSAILAGLATASHEGIAGALVQWIVLVLSSTMLIAVYRGVECRIDRPFMEGEFLGLASRMPRLAVFFAISGLTMVGLPGTLGFPGEDLLLHGVLAKHAWWGAALPVAIALNAYHAFRLFARLFLGKDNITRSTAFDALPRERWAFSACLAFLVWGGLFPRQVISIQADVTSALVRTAEVTPVRHP